MRARELLLRWDASLRGAAGGDSEQELMAGGDTGTVVCQSGEIHILSGETVSSSWHHPPPDQLELPNTKIIWN